MILSYTMKLVKLAIPIFAILMLVPVNSFGQQNDTEELITKIQRFEREIAELKNNLQNTNVESEKYQRLSNELNDKLSRYDRLIDRLDELMPITESGTLVLGIDKKGVHADPGRDFDIIHTSTGCSGDIQQINIQGFADHVYNEVRIEQVATNPISVGVGELNYCKEAWFSHVNVTLENRFQHWECVASFTVDSVEDYPMICPTHKGGEHPKNIHVGDLLRVEFQLIYEYEFFGTQEHILGGSHERTFVVRH